MRKLLIGFDYKNYQKGYKDLGDGYAVWFPSIAKKLYDKYISTDDYTGWINVLSEDKKKIVQLDNHQYSNFEKKTKDLNKRLIFARFDNDKRYRFIGVYGSEKRVDEGYEYTQLGTKFDTLTRRIIDT